VLAGVEEGVGGGLVLLDVHARERLEDAAEQHLHVAVVAGEVLGDDLAVEHRHPLGRRHLAVPAVAGHGLDELDDGLPRPGVVPGRQRVSRRHRPLL
jgi:hypothetical protein